MTNTTYFNVNKDYESSPSSSSQASEFVDTISGEEDNQASSSSKVPSSLAKKIRGLLVKRRRRPGERKGVVRQFQRQPRFNHHEGIPNTSSLNTEIQKTMNFSYSQLQIATDDWSLYNMIGKGGTARVYKGMLPGNREIALKYMDPSYWGDTDERYFMAEILILSVLEHHNIVKLYGFCSERDVKIIVMEYFENGSTTICYFYIYITSSDHHAEESGSHLDWTTRFNIMLGTARGLAYLHEEANPRIIHRDKSDVYGFGVVALETLCGCKNTDYGVERKEEANLNSYAWSLYENNHGMELVDPRLASFDSDEAGRMLHVALLCTQASPLRPPMSKVVDMLTGHMEVCPLTEKPYFLSNLEDTDMTLPDITEEDDELVGVNNILQKFSYEDLETATQKFSPVNKLGQGGFGPVYKGTLCDNREIAVKKLLRPSPHKECQFEAEISTISAVQHPNLVKLYGCCIEEDERLLVYEYLINKSLDQALFGKSDLHLDWTTRYNICLGVAKVLAYFHEESSPTIIHRDVKSSNILLDIDLNPKISDLGLARLYDDRKVHMTTTVGGTIGDVAPEYAMCGRLTEKVDIFGFGIVALEILCGRPVINSHLSSGNDYLLQLVWTLYEAQRSLELVDKRLTGFNKEEAIRLLGVALLCTQASPKLRPRMSEVVVMLTGNNEVAPVTEKPMYLAGW